MPVFRYKAYNAKGIGVSGEVEAHTLKEAVSSLKSGGIFPREVNSVQDGEARGIKGLRGVRFTRKVSLMELAASTRQLATLLKAGVALFDSLGFLVNEEENKLLQSSFSDVKEKVSEGVGLANALEPHLDVFPEVYMHMVEAGEASGTLDKVLFGLADYLEKRSQVRSKVVTAFIYPALMTLVGISVLSFLLLFVMPKIIVIFEDTNQALPFITVMLLTATHFLRSFWFLIIIVIIGLFWAGRVYINKPKGKAIMDALLLKLPVIGRLLRDYYSQQLAMTLGSLLESGVPILKALEMTGRVLNQTEFTKVVENSIEEVTEGNTLSKSFEETVLPPLLVHMTSIGERSGELDVLLLKAGQTYAKSFETSVARALSLVEPILILLMGFMVGFIVLAILLPIFELNQMVG